MSVKGVPGFGMIISWILFHRYWVRHQWNGLIFRQQTYCDLLSNRRVLNKLIFIFNVIQQMKHTFEPNSLVKLGWNIQKCRTVRRQIIVFDMWRWTNHIDQKFFFDHMLCCNDEWCTSQLRYFSQRNKNYVLFYISLLFKITKLVIMYPIYE